MKYLILGAGPAGLAFANCLKQKGISDFIVLEKEKEAGGLCRSALVDGSPFDIGGGHFLDVRRPNVNSFLFEFMPESEWNLFERDSRISIYNTLIGHPIEANIWQMPADIQKEHLLSIENAGCNKGVPMPQKFVDWIVWKLGEKIANDYMLPYNQKMFGEDLDCLGTYWLEKLPNVSLEETRLSCENHKAYGTQPGHAKFYYPKKHGYGELWRRMAEAIKDNICYNSSVQGIDFTTKTVTCVDGSKFNADIIITTIPWLEFTDLTDMPDELMRKVSTLKYSSIQTEYFPERMDTPCHWIYYPEPQKTYHRILVRHNFCEGSKGYWTETNKDRVLTNSNSLFSYMNQYAYPLNTADKPQIMKELLLWCEENNVYGLGRWGEHQHYNSDLTVELAMSLAEKLA